MNVLVDGAIRGIDSIAGIHLRIKVEVRVYPFRFEERFNFGGNEEVPRSDVATIKGFLPHDTGYE